MKDFMLYIYSFLIAAFITIFLVFTLPLTVLVIIFLFAGFIAFVYMVAECSYRICKYLSKKLFKED